MFLGNVSGVISDFSPFTWLRCYQKVLSLSVSEMYSIWPDRVRSTGSGIPLDRDCSLDRRNLYNMLESEQTQRHIAYLHQPSFTFSLNLRNYCGVESVKTFNLNQVDVPVYRDRGVAEWRAAGGRDAQSRSAYGQSVNTSEDGAALINTEVIVMLQISTRFRHNLKSVVKRLTV